jgi:tRNA nucleotidyltransferase (CCA-adding enzyme)
VEDPSRILRASRFERRFGFIIGRHTLNLIRNAVRLDLIARLPKPRLFGELELILKEEDPSAILHRLAEFNIGPSIHSKIPLDRKHLALLEETAEILVWFSLLFLDEKVEKWGVLFLALLDPLAPEEARAFAAELGVGRKAREWVRIAKFEADELIHKLLAGRTISRKIIYDCFHSMPTEVILYMMAKSKHPDIRRYISLYFTQLKNVRPLITGKDLLELGYPPGPDFKRIFDEVLERKFTGELKTKAAETSFVLSHFPKK